MAERKGKGTRPARPQAAPQTRQEPSPISDDDIYLFNEGSHFTLYDRLGAHPLVRDGRSSTYFAVWAPDAERVGVAGDFNGWDDSEHQLEPRKNSGIWEGFIDGVGKGALYKFRIDSRFGGYRVDKADPMALFAEVAPKTASVVWDLDYEWQDGAWMAERAQRQSLNAPPLRIPAPPASAAITPSLIPISARSIPWMRMNNSGAQARIALKSRVTIAKPKK